MDRYKTKVVFRQFPDGDIIAIFPYVAYNFDPTLCMSYQTVGQHGACDKALIQELSQVTDFEGLQSLKSELKSIGYNLKEVQNDV